MRSVRLISVLEAAGYEVHPVVNVPGEPLVVGVLTPDSPFHIGLAVAATLSVDEGPEKAMAFLEAMEEVPVKVDGDNVIFPTILFFRFHRLSCKKEDVGLSGYPGGTKASESRDDHAHYFPRF